MLNQESLGLGGRSSSYRINRDRSVWGIQTFEFATPLHVYLGMQFRLCLISTSTDDYPHVKFVHPGNLNCFIHPSPST